MGKSLVSCFFETQCSLSAYSFCRPIADCYEDFGTACSALCLQNRMLSRPSRPSIQHPARSIPSCTGSRLDNV